MKRLLDADGVRVFWFLLALATVNASATQPPDAPSRNDLDLLRSNRNTALMAIAPLPEITPPKGGLSEHRFWDRTNILLFSGIAVTRGLDYASTRNFEARGRQEILLPQDVVDNSAGFASLEVAGTMTSIGLSYLLHRTGHHSLERWLSIGHISVTAFGDARNYALKTKHPH